MGHRARGQLIIMYIWQIRDRQLTIDHLPLVMGIVNVTPDSFSNGGNYLDADAAVAHGLELARQGADLLDIGGESTRPGAVPVTPAEELRRVVPVVQKLASQTSLPLSVDTAKAEVARQCLAAGAHIINDVTALTGDPGMPQVARDMGAGVVLMHMQGTPQTMQQAPQYADVVAEIFTYLEARLHRVRADGIATEQVVLDPGIGFGKTAAHNLEILASLRQFQRLGRPVCLGISRKAFVGKLLGDRPIGRRLAGSLGAVCYAMSQSAVQIVRVHDVEATKDAVTMFATLHGHRATPSPT
jgi:dihydropteroate synthase